MIEAGEAEFDEAPPESTGEPDESAEPVEVEEAAIEAREALLAPIPPGAVAEAEAAFDQSTADELADLREVLRLGRHLLEGRQVTL